MACLAELCARTSDQEHVKMVLLLKPKTQILLSEIGRAELHELITGFARLMGGRARHWLAMPPTIIDA